MSQVLLDARTARATWTILVIVGVLGLAYVLRNVLLLAALSLSLPTCCFPWSVGFVEKCGSAGLCNLSPGAERRGRATLLHRLEAALEAAQAEVDRLYTRWAELESKQA